MIPQKSSENRQPREEAEQKLQLAVLDALIYSPLSIDEIKHTVSEILSDAISISEQVDLLHVSDEDKTAVLREQMSKCEFFTTGAIQ